MSVHSGIASQKPFFTAFWKPLGRFRLSSLYVLYKGPAHRATSRFPSILIEWFWTKILTKTLNTKYRRVFPFFHFSTQINNIFEYIVESFFYSNELTSPFPALNMLGVPSTKSTTVVGVTLQGPPSIIKSTCLLKAS